MVLTALILASMVLLTLTFMIDTHNWKAALAYNVIPAGVSFLCALSATALYFKWPIN